MYSEKLERLIQLSIEDGMIDETENSVLINCAKEEGVDIDELTLYVNSLLKKRQRELESEVTSKAQKYEKEKKEAIGNICPKCGKQVPAMSVVCPYCGCEIVSKDANSSVKDLLSKIERINREGSDATLSRSVDKLLDMFADNPTNKIDEKEKQIRDTISLYPVPNTKEDILEFLSLSASLATQKFKWHNSFKGRLVAYIVVSILLMLLMPLFGAGLPFLLGVFVLLLGFTNLATSSTIKETTRAQKRRDVWKSKFKQVLLKGRSIHGDADFQQQLDYFEKLVK